MTTESSTMDQDVLEEWCADLESGRIPQARNRLALDSGRCCLGVLCDIAVRHGVISQPKETDDLDFVDSVILAYGPDKDTTMLPQEVSRWAGFPSLEGESEDHPMGVYTCDPFVELTSEVFDYFEDTSDEREQERLSALNDEGLPFPLIAKLIRLTYGPKELG